MNSQFTYSEITSQPTAWEEALNAFSKLEATLASSWQSLQPKQVVFIGCGSTHYLALSAAALFQQLTGVPAKGYPSSELLLFNSSVMPNPAETLLVAISRSGTTTETITAVSQYREQGGLAVWSITCYPDSPMAKASDLVLAAAAAQEKSVAQTRSFASMLLLAQALAAHIGQKDWRILEQLPEVGRALLDHTEPLVKELATQPNLTRFTFLGSGAQYGVASEIMLKMTEMSLTVSQAFHFLEYRHGPMSMANNEAAIIGLISPVAGNHERQVLAEMGEKGATILTLAADSGSDIQLPSNLPDWAYPVLYLPTLQLLAYHRSISKGLDPDNPRNLTAVIYLDPAVF